MISKRSKLRDLVRKYPDWTNQQYADALGQRVDTIRGALSIMGLSRNKNKPKKQKPTTRVKRPMPATQVDGKPQTTVASRAGPTRSGYTKLM